MLGRTRLLLAPALLLAGVGSAAADNPTSGEYKLVVGGYGELSAAYLDFGEDQNRDGGALSDHRVELDTTRFVIELEGHGPHGLTIEVEAEFEHGGVGAAREIEHDEFGEFETEVEKGGEITLEEFQVKKRLGRFELAVGRFYVPVGMLSYYYRPTDYLGSVRSEAETTVLPAQWDEMGVALHAYLGRVRATAAVVNGLDSTGFSSKYWVSAGHQGAYELTRGRDLAVAARVDVEVGGGLTVGAAGYVGGTTNRPKPDLVRECDDPDTGAVAPCGYVSAPVVMGDVHARWAGHGFRGQAWGLVGHLSKARAISERNDRLSNEAGVERTPVADNAIALAAELGYDLAPALGMCAGQALEPFARVDYYDTMWKVRDDLFDNPRFERLVVGAGAAYSLGKGFVTKLDVSQRRFGSGDLRAETTVRAMVGFWY